MYHFQGVTLRRAVPEAAEALSKLVTENDALCRKAWHAARSTHS